MEIFACLVYLEKARTLWKIDFPCLKGFQETLRNKFQLAKFKEILTPLFGYSNQRNINNFKRN